MTWTILHFRGKHDILRLSTELIDSLHGIYVLYILLMGEQCTYTFPLETLFFLCCVWVCFFFGGGVGFLGISLLKLEAWEIQI